MKFYIIMSLFFISNINCYLFAFDNKVSINQDTTIAIIMNSLRDIQSKSNHNNFYEITDEYCSENVKWLNTSCGDTLENKIYTKDSDKFIEIIKDILNKTRFYHIHFQSPNSIRLLFLPGPKECFPSQILEVSNSLHEPNTIFVSKDSENKRYFTTSGYSIFIEVHDSKIRIYKLLLAYSC